jgi:hypothetical protein
MDNRFIDKPILNSPPYGFPLVIANDDANSELNRLPLKLATGGGQTTVEICHLIPHVFYFVAENLVLPPGCRPYPTGRKLGQVRENRLCREHMPRNDGILEFWPPARRAYAAYASERILGIVEWDLFL